LKGLTICRTQASFRNEFGAGGWHAAADKDEVQSAFARSDAGKLRRTGPPSLDPMLASFGETGPPSLDPMLASFGETGPPSLDPMLASFGETGYADRI
jgi:hypothetical protein